MGIMGTRLNIDRDSLIKAEEILLTEGAGHFEPDYGTVASPGHFMDGEASSQLSCHLSPFTAESQSVVHHVKDSSASHPQASSGDVYEGLDAGLRENVGTWSGHLSTQDVGIMETSLGSDRNRDVKFTAVQCTVNVEMTPSTSGKKLFSCHLCPYTSRFKQVITRHVRAHTKERPFTCNVCSRSFSRKRALTKHTAIHTDGKCYKCNKCPAERFNSKTDFTQHMYLHSGRKLFECGTCSRVFPTKANLTLHMRTHTGEKPYKCEFCLLSFSQRSNLMTHKRRHTGGVSYTCSVCSSPFTSKHSLLLHAVTHKMKQAI